MMVKCHASKTFVGLLHKVLASVCLILYFNNLCGLRHVGASSSSSSSSSSSPAPLKPPSTSSQQLQTDTSEYEYLEVEVDLSSVGTPAPVTSALDTADQFVVDNGRNNKIGAGNACASITSCQNCSHTYTCHWCDHDQSCHARGSVHGCAWGGRCGDQPKPKPPKENSTCSSHLTCSDCALSSRFCHWCEHDNSCHAVGSPYGCTIGVDCYSNDRCRRTVPEPLYSGGGANIVDQILPDDIPTASLMGIGIVGLIFICCFSCCHFFATSVKGAYDDLATITMAASLAPMSVVGGPDGQVVFYTALEPHPEEEEGQEEEDNNNSVEEGIAQENPARNDGSDSPSATPAEVQRGAPVDEEVINPTSSSRQEHNEPLDDHYHLMNDEIHNNSRYRSSSSFRQESRPLLHPSFNGSVVGLEESRHMRRLYTACSVIYYISIGLVVVTMMAAVYFYPSIPTYNVCNDAVAWKRIMGNIVRLEIDASFEILISLKNANRISAALEVGKGSFKFEGQHIGRYEIPSVVAPASAITDIMLITHVTPDKYQALRLAEAYYMGKLILEAEFEGTIRVPALWDYTFDVSVKNIRVDVNALSDRSLCHCPSWDDQKNHSTVQLPFLENNYQQLLIDTTSGRQT